MFILYVLIISDVPVPHFFVGAGAMVPAPIHVTAGPRWGEGNEGWHRSEGAVRQYPKIFRGGGIS